MRVTYICRRILLTWDLKKNLGPGPKKIYGTFVDCVREFVDGDAGELRDSSGLYPGRDAALKGQAFAKIY